MTDTKLKQVTFCQECLKNKLGQKEITGIFTFEGIEINFPSIVNCGPREPCLWCAKHNGNDYAFIDEANYDKFKGLGQQ